MSEIRDKLVLKGTTTIGVVCRDGIILASDTRVTMGTFIAHKRGKKIYMIADHLAMTIAGGVADAQWTVDMLKVNARLYELNMGRRMPIHTAARLMANVLFSARGGLLTQVVVGGVDDSGFHVFTVDPLGSLTEEKCVATGSGSPIAYGVLEDQYKEDALVEGLLHVVVKAVDSAMKRDSASGDSFDVAVINQKGFKQLSDQEKKQLLA
jgi:proteasome beta subunit